MSKEENKKIVKKYFRKFFSNEYLEENDQEFKSLMRILNKKDQLKKLPSDEESKYPKVTADQIYDKLISGPQSDKFKEICRYLKRSYKNDITDFRLKYLSDETFYLHPLDKDGETLDIDMKIKSKLK